MITTPQSASEIFTDIQGLQEIRREKNDQDALKKVSQQFESMFVNMMMKSMRDANAAFEQDSLFQSNETQFYRDMYDQQLALSMSHGKGLGIAETLYRQMSQQYGYDRADKTESAGQTPSLMTSNVRYDTSSTPKAYTIDSHRTGRALSENYRTGVASKPLVSNAENIYTNANQNFSAQSSQEFVNHLMPFAQASSSQIGTDPYILIAQSALETGWGRSVIQDSIGRSSNNLFNIKASAQWQGESVSVETKEYVEGHARTEQASFRKYSSIRQSFDDFVNFISDNPRYKKAMEAAENSYEFIKELQHAGYATDPHYADKIISIYNRVKAMVSATTASASNVQGGQP